MFYSLKVYLFITYYIVKNSQIFCIVIIFLFKRQSNTVYFICIHKKRKPKFKNVVFSLQTIV